MSWLKPTGLAVLLFVLLLVLQVAFLSSLSATYKLPGPDEPYVRTTYGFGSPIVVESEGGATRIDVRWVVLIVNLLTCSVLALAGAALIGKLTALRRPGLVYLVATLAVCGLSFLFSIGASRYYWGYYLSRPPLPSKAGELLEVDAVVPVMTTGGGRVQRKLEHDPDYSISGSLSHAEEDPYYCLDERILVRLRERGLLPSVAANWSEALAGLLAEVEASGILATPEEGYESPPDLSGVVVVGRNVTDEGLVFVGLTGTQVANDHYPYYELVFRQMPEGLELLQSQRFFYDVAGVEGLEWYVIWPIAFIVGLVVVLPLLTVVLVLRGLFRRRSAGVSAPLA